MRGVHWKRLKYALQRNTHCSNLPTSIFSSQAKAFVLLLAVKVVEHWDTASMFTDNMVLSRATVANNVIDDPGH
jgi:hypothetical protein